MEKRNKVYIGTSLDGFIADKEGGLDWLDSIPNTDQIDMGYGAFMAQVDALVMGRNTFDTVCGFDIDWPYDKPVFVLSHTLKQVPESLQDKVQIVCGSLQEVLEEIRRQGYRRLYIDGGKTIQSFLREDLIDEMTITTIPILLGSGIPLFGELEKPLLFECLSSQIFLGKIVQSHYVRKRHSEF
ncbi:dihydrofolate reductase family protein [Algoriphagus limi]|uniref:Dihydrofolate reductase family protein n=1 Tax=Algoriphagus limi TaxID=2975273 RepID=A0ABT2G787_9BACT|nr:dihydrofolate reductase family protein [Algoriphagus limi]MCS5491128.1 dihydrofolate reductase family protein [Algoriphagus limi]